MTISRQAIAAVRGGAVFVADFRRRRLTVNGKPLIDGGRYEGSLGMRLCSTERFLAVLSRLYRRYRHSVPSERSERKGRRYFVPLQEHELEEDDWLYGESRELARLRLELFVLVQSLLGFRWDEGKMGKWFWQDPENKDLILLREWMENNDNE